MASSGDPLYCSLCQKGFKQFPQMDAHLSSYEHNHAVNRSGGNKTFYPTQKPKRKAEQSGEMRKLDLNVMKAKKRAIAPGAGFQSIESSTRRPEGEKPSAITVLSDGPSPPRGSEIGTEREPEPALEEAADSIELPDMGYELYDPWKPCECQRCKEKGIVIGPPSPGP
ncbi:hypothetical protein K402DRAFT_392989 [Aulographum hederae CBS 113979]|uniref:C2H2-type domain-containing protein n=1 Tax=Aulographum hederae CBS 113979 TaxID=1176131 RepID=A0A6G1H2P6_9PEZI|nr:hypothetical protein K402DRAFT_392989 [Aulographum hederae CBS 113979]